MTHDATNTDIRILTMVDMCELKELDDSKLLIYNASCFQIGRILFDCIDRLQHSRSIDDAVSYVKGKYGLELENDSLKGLIASSIDKIDTEYHKVKSSLFDSIYFKKKLMSRRMIEPIASKLAFLFKRWVRISIFVAFTLSNIAVATFYFRDVTFFLRLTSSSNWYVLIPIYIAVTLIALIHEFGHASASIYHSMPPKEIGFGIFMVVPVFYTDVSSIWSMERRKRIIVNYGGIYFQMILSTMFSMVILLNLNEFVLLIMTTVFFVNLFLMLYSLNPFFRNDGYWIYSDSFNIVNLGYKARNYHKVVKSRIISTEISSKDKATLFFKDTPLIVYSILNYALIVMLYVALYFLTKKNVVALMELIEEFDGISMTSMFKIFRLVLLIGLNIFFIYKTLLLLLTTLKRKFLL